MKKIFLVLFILILIGLITGYYLYNKIFNESITGFTGDKKELFIPTNSSDDDIIYRLSADSIINDIDAFKKIAGLKKTNQLAKPGRYIISKGISANNLINKLRIGDQTPMNLTFNNARTRAELAGKLSKYIEADSISILDELNSSETHKKYGFNNETFNSLFLPNTYQTNWNTTPENLIKKMAGEYKSFWNSDRKSKARKLGLSQSEVVTLASIVKAETAKKDEAPKVAGLYLNRLKKGMLLQADPTLVFALGDFGIKRVLNKHKEIDSPYNTYKYTGLPPGPINIPAAVYIDAVLNPATHKYIFMCAKPDFSGYHNFAKTNAQHEAYARKYRKALSAAGIYR